MAAEAKDAIELWDVVQENRLLFPEFSNRTCVQKSLPTKIKNPEGHLEKLANSEFVAEPTKNVIKSKLLKRFSGNIFNENIEEIRYLNELKV